MFHFDDPHDDDPQPMELSALAAAMPPPVAGLPPPPPSSPAAVSAARAGGRKAGSGNECGGDRDRDRDRDRGRDRAGDAKDHAAVEAGQTKLEDGDSDAPPEMRDVLAHQAFLDQAHGLSTAIASSMAKATHLVYELEALNTDMMFELYDPIRAHSLARSRATTLAAIAAVDAGDDRRGRSLGSRARSG